MLEYACELWDGCSQQDSDNLEKLQIEAGRIVTGLPLFAVVNLSILKRVGNYYLIGEG
jgi:hypothetical protein